MFRQRTGRMTRNFRIQFTATFLKEMHSAPRQDGVSTSLVVVVILLLVLLLFCRMVSSLLYLCRLERLARSLDTAFVSSELVTNKLNHILIAEPQGPFRPSFVRLGQVEEAQVLHSGSRHKHQESFTSTASMATTETMDSCKPAYADSPDRMQDFGVVEEDDSTSASDIMNDKERWMIDYDIHNLRKYTPPQHSLPLPPANATLPDLFDLTASQRTEFIERARRDSQSDGSQHDEPWCNDRHHTRRRCCSPTPVRDLMEKGEKILGDAVRPYESMKVPQSPQKVGVGFGSIPGTENRPFSDADSIASHQMHTNDDMYPGTPSVTPNTKLGSMPWVIGGVFDGCDDRGANTDTAVDSYCSPMGKIEDSKHARESPHLGAWRINTPDRSSSLGVVIRNPPCFGGEGLGSPKRLNPKRGSPLRREGRKVRSETKYSDRQASAVLF